MLLRLTIEKRGRGCSAQWLMLRDFKPGHGLKENTKCCWEKDIGGHVAGQSHSFSYDQFLILITGG